MSSRITLICIMLAYCSDSTCSAVTVSWASSICPFQIPENTSKDAIKTFTADGNPTNYTIISQSVNGRFLISSTGVLSSETKLDYDRDEKSYSVEIMATTSNASVNATLKCVINVTDVNDEPPKFVKKAYSVDTFNNVAINTAILTVRATDKDVTETFKKVEYNITENGANFTINNATGVISAKTVLTAAGPFNLTLKVVATDKDVTTLRDEASVRVCVGCKTSGSASPQISLFASMALVFGVVWM